MVSLTSNDKLPHYGILFLFALLLMFVATFMSNEAIREHRYQQFQQTEQYLHHFYDRISANLHSYIQLLGGLSSLFIANPDLPEDLFAKSVRHIIAHNPEIRNVSAAPDRVIRYMYPLEGNEKVIGSKFRQIPQQFELADRSRRAGVTLLSGSVDLVQGGTGLIIRMPVYINNKNNEQQFWGLISMMVDMELFLQKTGILDTAALPIKLAIRGQNDLGQPGEVFYGELTLLENPQLLLKLASPKGGWVLAAEPLDGWNSLPRDIWIVGLTYYGVALVIFLFFVLALRPVFSASQATNRFRDIFEGLPIPSMLLGQDGRVHSVNKVFSDKFGYTMQELSALENWWNITDDARKNQLQFKKLIAKNVQTGQQTREPDKLHHKLRITHTDGKKTVVCLSVSMLASSNLDNKVLVLIYDITDQKQIDERMRLSLRVFNQAQEGIMITTTAGVIKEINPAFCNITGYSREEVIGQQPSVLKSGRQPTEFYEKLWQSILQHGYWQGEVWNLNKNGKFYACLLTISALSDDDGETRHFVGLYFDITKMKQQQETLEMMAHYDMLTKLPNRVLFTDRFNQAVAHSQRTNTLLAVCFLDLDGFKLVNDTCGHKVGDQLLVEVASRLKEGLREEDTVSRFGGDEFAILIRDLSTESECEQLLKRLHGSLALPFIIDSNILKISASSGVTFYPTDDSDLSTLLRHADQSMYQAKLLGRNMYHLFNLELNQQTRQRQQWLEAFRCGVEQEQFHLYYQPKVNLRTGKVIGLEALIRWNHPEQGWLLPSKFLPLIQGTQMEVEVGNWVIVESLKQLALLHQHGYLIEVSVNIAYSHLLSGNFTADTITLLELQPGVDSSYLQLELLETAALVDIAAVSKVIKSVQSELGFSFALDDFGTGYSSLEHLRHLSVETIKIDQSFVRNMLDNPQDFMIVDVVINLAGSYGRNVIAEGVETHDHGRMLLMMGCECAQGNGIAPPMPAEEVLPWLQQYRPDQECMHLVARPLSDKERALQIFHLTSQRWLNKFVDCVMTSPFKMHEWPTMSANKCHCGRWIKRVTPQGLFDKAWLQTVDSIHRELHDKASQIQQHYLNWEIDKARERLDEVKLLAKEMDEIVVLASKNVDRLKSMPPEKKKQQ